MVRAAVCVFAGALALSAQAPAPSPTDAASAQALIGKYCIGCHNDKLKTADVSFAQVHMTDPGASAAILERVLRKVGTGEMPPLGIPGPDQATRASFTGWLSGQLDSVAAKKPNPGAPAIHRMNRIEYSNAIRDLLALDIDHSAALPQDDSGYGFDNIGAVLTVSPLHMEKYMSSARKIARMALGTMKASPAIEKFNAGRNIDNVDELPMNERGGIVVRRYFPLDAEYSFLVRVRGNPAPNTPGPKLDLRIDGRREKLFDVNINNAEEAQDSRNYERRLPLKAGIHLVAAAFLGELEKSEMAPPAGRRGAAPTPFAAASVESMTVAGPFNVSGPGDTESRKRIFVCHPGAGKTEEACATQIVSSLAHRAYRRPATQADLAPLMKLYAAGRTDGGNFEAGIEMALRAVLVSPDFLFRVERDPSPATPGANHKVRDTELASRLSFFLWSSIPDDELLSIAEKGKLSDPKILRQQVVRMIADPKSKSLVDNFAGQWLQLRNIASWKPDPDKFPGFDDSLREALRRETELSFDYIMREDQSVLDLVNADYTFLNDRLAKHYGISGIRGSYFRKVALTDPQRGGILTQGSVLTVTSYPTRTSPVLRGRWILENILGAPPPPPPPDVPQLKESSVGSPKNLREQLEKHRSNAGCAGCHSRMDPLGFALENFDATGKFRTSDSGADIDASGQLPNGEKVSGPGDLKKVIMERKDQFVETFADKMLTYALGRGLEYYDEPAVREIRRQTAAGDYKFSAFVQAVVDSVPFQMRRTPDR